MKNVVLNMGSTSPIKMIQFETIVSIEPGEIFLVIKTCSINWKINPISTYMKIRE